MAGGEHSDSQHSTRHVREPHQAIKIPKRPQEVHWETDLERTFKRPEDRMGI